MENIEKMESIDSLPPEEQNFFLEAAVLMTLEELYKNTQNEKYMNAIREIMTERN